MKIFPVGGYVRDMLLRKRGFKLPEGDRDWVVIGETPEAMIKRGYLPVGGDFPVFLHPRSHEEYALARTERKTAPGYHGFIFHASPDVTLEEDLARRDLTINAMALAPDGFIIDPFGGQHDLAAGILRHVSPAFAEDPVRILRIARFAARLPSFSIAPETMALMRRMVDSGEADALVPERVLAEFTKGLRTATPCRMLDILTECGFCQRLYPELRLSAQLRGRLHRARLANFPVDLLLAVLASGIEGEAKNLKAPTPGRQFLARIRASAQAQEFAQILTGGTTGGIEKLRNITTFEDTIEFLRQLHALRKPGRAKLLLALRNAVLQPPEGSAETIKLAQTMRAWTSVDAGAAAQTAASPKEIAQKVLTARVQAAADAWRAEA